MDLSMVATISRSSADSDIKRVTRKTRAKRAMFAKEPAAGNNDTATITKSKTFQPSLKKANGRGQYEIKRIPISNTKITWIAALSAANSSPYLAVNVDDVSNPKNFPKTLGDKTLCQASQIAPYRVTWGRLDIFSKLLRL